MDIEPLIKYKKLSRFVAKEIIVTSQCRTGQLFNFDSDGNLNDFLNELIGKIIAAELEVVIFTIYKYSLWRIWLFFYPLLFWKPLKIQYVTHTSTGRIFIARLKWWTTR